MLINDEPDFEGTPSDVWAKFVRVAALASEDFTAEYLERLKEQRWVQQSLQNSVPTGDRAHLILLLDALAVQVQRVADIVDKARLYREIDEATKGLSI